MVRLKKIGWVSFCVAMLFAAAPAWGAGEL